MAAAQNKAGIRAFSRLSVRGLMLGVLVAGAWFGWVSRRAHLQHEAVMAIERAGGKVCYDWEWKDGKPVIAGESWWRNLQSKTVGIDVFGRVVAVRLEDLGRRLDEAGVNADVESVKAAHGNGPNASVTDRTLDRLKNLPDVQYVEAPGSDITDDGLSRLRALTGLRGLQVAATNISDAGLSLMGAHPDLETLCLNFTRVSDTGIASLSRMTNLRELYLFGLFIDDASLKHIKPLTRLKRLDLSVSKITDEGLIELSGLTALKDARPWRLSHPWLWFGASAKDKRARVADTLRNAHRRWEFGPRGRFQHAASIGPIAHQAY